MITPRVILKAAAIANTALNECYTPVGIIAGPHHFVDLWARDSLFATYGILNKKDFPVFRKTIETFLQFQRNDGLIPYRVMRSKSNLQKYFGKPTLRKTLEPNFYSHMSLGLVPDGGLMAIIASANYVSRSGDAAWLQKVYPSLVRSIEWYGKRFGNSLISEWFQCEWADGVLKSGNTLYTNVLYLKALKDMAAISNTYEERYETMFQKFHSAFWNGKYFSDWIDWTRHDHIATHANFLAIIYGLTTSSESESILTYAKRHCVNTFTLHNTHPAYPIWRIPLIQILGGVPDYHNRGILWLQPGITYALALYYSGKKNLASEWLTKVAAHIVKYKGVFEVYESLTGAPLNRRFYKSEGPFAWSAGLFLWACNVIQ